jgi:hypothetical protein
MLSFGRRLQKDFRFRPEAADRGGRPADGGLYI